MPNESGEQPELREPVDWQEECGRTVKNPDGWRRSDLPGYPGSKDFRVPVTREEFMARSEFSTCAFH